MRKRRESELPHIDNNLIHNPPSGWHRRRSRLPTSLKNSKTISTSHSNNDMSLKEKSNWENMENVIHPKDDFLCFPNTEAINDLTAGCNSKRARLILRRKSSAPIVPEDKTSGSQVDDFPEMKNDEPSFLSICDFNKKSNMDFVLSGTEEMMPKMRRELDHYLQLTSEKMQQTNDLVFDPTSCTREYFIAKKLYAHFQVEKYRKHIQQLQYNIRIIAELEDFVRQSDQKSYIDFQSFQKYYLCDSQSIYEAAEKTERFQAYMQSIDQVPKDVSWECIFLHPSQKTGRIMRRLIAKIDEMTYYDIEVIIKALCNDVSQVPKIRKLIFDLAWQKYIFPFVDAMIIELPDIFDLTPRIFDPPFLTDEVLDIPFNRLNSIDWPFRQVSENLFELLIETDPFLIADRIWDIISQITEVTNQIVIKSGQDPEDADIGFEVLFKFLLVIIFAFGVSEVLEVMDFCRLFYDFTNNDDSQKQFAMTHCNGLVKYISSMNSVELHHKFGKK